MRQHLTTLAATVRERIAKNATRIAFGIFFLFSSAEARWTMVEVYALAMPLLMGWYMIAKYRYLRWMAASEQRAAESKARMDAAWEREEQRQADLRAGQSDADWFNWDGPFTVAGQPR